MRFKVQRFEYATSTNIPTGGDKSLHYILLLLLTGGLKIHSNNMIIKQDVNQTVIPPSVQSHGLKQAVEDVITYYDINMSVKRFIKSTLISKNRTFFSDILSELTHYFIMSESKCHMAAFVYLYRILERISYSTPLVYAQKANDYYATFDDMKKMFSDSSMGEYGLFKKFIKGGSLIEQSILDSEYVIDFSTCIDKASYISKIGRILNGVITVESQFHQVKFHFKNTMEVLTVIRNRFFHMRTGDRTDNISTKDFGDPEPFFLEINKACSSFICIVIMHLIAHDVID
ncbi:hypothetical protein [Aeromonas salmonicida]